MIGRKLAHYEIVEKIGEGGMGEVYRARDEHLDRDVAIKLLPEGKLRDEAARRRFRQEALALSKLSHPNVQTVHDFDLQDGQDFLVIEYVPGVSLDEKVNPGLDEKEVVKLGIQMCAGLKAAHEQGIVHRDLKPANLRLTPDGRLKILDFGLAKLMDTPGPPDDDGTTMSRFRTQTFGGTPHYMSPEQRSGASLDARSDLYTGGMVLQELLGKRTPSTGLRRVIDRCLEPEPQDRYESAAELQGDLERLQKLSGHTTKAAAVLVGVVVAVTLALGAAIFFGSRDTSSGTIRSLVALPATVIGAEEDAFLADAIPKTVSSHLTRVEGLETKLPPSTADVELLGGDFERIARAYDVSALVMATVTARDEQLLLNLDLVDARDRTLLWSEAYDGTRESYLGLVNGAAEDLQRFLRPDAAPSEDGAVEAEASSRVALAFQEGLYYSNRYNNRHEDVDFDRAHAAFVRTLDFDPGFSDAAAEIAWLYEFKMEAGEDPSEGLRQIEVWSRRALAIDLENGRAWAALTLAQTGQGSTGGSVLTSGLRAVAHAPDFPRSHMALIFALPSCRLGLAAAQESERLDPFYLYAPLMVGNRQACLGVSPAEVQRSVAFVMSIESEFPAGMMFLANGFGFAGNDAGAAALLERVEPMLADGRVDPATFAIVQDTHLVLRNGDGAAMERLKAVASGSHRSPSWHEWMFATVSILALRGHDDLARDLVLRLHDAGVVWLYDGLMARSNRAWIREDPALADVVTRSRESFEAMLVDLDDARERGELPPYLEEPLAEIRAELGYD